jgi:hypothetical protein
LGAIYARSGGRIWIPISPTASNGASRWEGLGLGAGDVGAHNGVFILPVSGALTLMPCPLQVRVLPLEIFNPLPADVLELVVPRKLHPEDGSKMKFFERTSNKVKEIWELFAQYAGKY